MKKSKVNIISWTVIILGSIVILLPFLWMLLSAFKSSSEIYSVPPTFFPKKINLDGFKKVLFEVPFFNWLFNSLFVAVLTAVGVLFTSSIMGYIFAKFDFKWKNTYFIIILATLMVPFQVVMIPTYLIISRMNLTNSYGALIIPSLVSAFGIFLCRQFISSVPNDLLEAAKIDGATAMKIYVRIIIPEIKPILAALAIFMFMFKWNDYLWPLIVINSTERMTVPLALTYFSSRHQSQINVIYAGALLIMAPIFIVYLIFQKQFVEGLSLTGIK